MSYVEDNVNPVALARHVINLVDCLRAQEATSRIVVANRKSKAIADARFWIEKLKTK